MHLVKSLRQSTLDIRLLWVSVFLRMASYGLTNQVLTLYLRTLKISEPNIGLFMTLTLVGDTVISYGLTWYADRIGRRLVMIIGSLMMFASGLVFACYSHFAVLLAAAIFGVISPSGDETGPFKSVEEAAIAHLTPDNHRPEIFAFYGLFATAGAALGSLVCGFVIDYLNLTRGYTLEVCYRSVFVIYMLVALLKFVIMMFLSDSCEIGDEDEPEDLSDDGEVINETNNLLTGNTERSPKGGLSNKTRHYLPRLLAIFMLDSLGYGFMPSAWVVYYLKTTFSITATTLGLLFFVTNSIDAISSLPSAFLSKYLGPVKAILFTQAPAAVCYIIAGYASLFGMVAVFLVLYYTTSTMDVVPRTILLTSIMPRHELTKVMGMVNIGKTFARCIGPIFTGKLAEGSRLYVGFVIAGSCTLVSDVILGMNFLDLDGEIQRKQSVETSF
jgi:MFS family permease